GSITISFWNYVTARNVQSSSAFSIGDSDTPNSIQAHVPNSDSVLYCDYGTDNNPGGRVSTNYSSYLGSWTYVTLEYNATSSTHAIYLNGSLAISSVNSTTPTTIQTGIQIGAWLQPYGLYDHATIDEFRVSTIARSADWIATEYNNQSSPSTFYTIGSVGSGGPDSGGPTITSLSPASGSVDTPITITGTNFGVTQN